MHLIDGDGHVNGQFVSEDVVSRQQPTVVTAEWLNAVQNELLAVILASGQMPDKANSEQLLAAIKDLIFPAGTRMPFAQASAPIGWTQDVSDNADNRMLRVVNTAGGGVAGTHSPVLNDVVPSHTHGFTTGTVSSDHSHYVSGSTSSSGSHSHTTSIGVVGAEGGTYGFIAAGQYATTTRSSSDGGVHSHSFGAQTGGISANHTHSGSTDNGSSQTNWQPRYIDLIICTKN